MVATCFLLQEERLRTSIAEIKAAMDKITDISNKNVMQDGQDSDRLQYFVHALRIYEAEFSVQVKEWKRVSQIVEEMAISGPLAVRTYEAIADILVRFTDFINSSENLIRCHESSGLIRRVPWAFYTNA